MLVGETRGARACHSQSACGLTAWLLQPARGLTGLLQAASGLTAKRLQAVRLA
jgi:hypothetical protein